MSDPFDEELRTRLGRSAGGGLPAHKALAELGPTLRRARRVHQVRSGVVGLVAALAIVGVGANLVGDRFGDDGTTVVAAIPEDDSDRTTSSPTSTSVPTSLPTQTSADGTPTTLVPDSEPETTDQTTPQTTTQTSEPTNTDTTPATTTPPSTTPPDTEQSTIDSDCGSIIVSVSDDDIELIEVDPDPGFEPDEKNGGPERVEVSFEGPDGHCEIEAEVRNGMLSSEVSNE